MKALFVIGVVLGVFWSLPSCKKDETNPTRAKETPVKPVYTYTMDILTGKDFNRGVKYDTIRIKINDVIVYTKAGQYLPDYINDIFLKSGDNLYIYHNPGTVPIADIDSVRKPQYNVLEASFHNGGGTPPYIKFNTRGPASWQGVME